MAEADTRLAEKLDECLKISDARRARFFMNKPKCDTHKDKNRISPAVGNLNETGKLKPKNLTKEELRERLLKKYGSLVPELDPKRPSVKLVVLSATESLEMAKTEARKQLDDQLKLSSVSGSQRAQKDGLDSFKFKDGYEMPPKGFYCKKLDVFQSSKNVRKSADKSTFGAAKSVKFSDQREQTSAIDNPELEAESKTQPNPYDFFLQDDEYDKITDDEE